MYRTDGNAANTGGLKKKKAELLLQFSRMIDRPPVFQNWSGTNIRFRLAGYRAPSFISARRYCAAALFLSSRLTHRRLGKK